MRRTRYLLLSLLVAGCVSAPLTSDSARLRQASSLMDNVAQDIEEFGTISVSSAAIIRDFENAFRFDLDLTAKELFDAERIETASSLENSQSLDIRGGLALKPPELEGEASAKDTLPDSNKAAAVLPSETFNEGLKIRDPGSLTLNLRSLIRLTADDHMTMKLLQWTSQPDLDTLGANKVLFGAVMNVSVRPGRRTYTGYLGEVDVFAQYMYKSAENDAVSALKADNPRSRHPVSFAIYPGIDAQVIDERTSLRRQMALALLLQAVQAGGKGAVDASFVKRIQQDIASVTTLNTVTGWNASGRHFGWRFSPRVDPQNDPSRSDALPGRRLEAQSFPALVLILADKDDLTPAVGGTNKTGADHIAFRYTQRWLRAPSPVADDNRLPFFDIPVPFLGEVGGAIDRLEHPRLSEQRVVDWALRLDQARELLNSSSTSVKARASGSVTESNAARTLENRLSALEAASVGTDTYWALPTITTANSPTIAVNGVAPARIPLNRDAWIVLKGRGLNLIDSFSIGGFSVVAEKKLDSHALVKIPAGTFKSAQRVEIGAIAQSSNDRPAPVITAGPIEFYEDVAPEAMGPERARVSITWEGSVPSEIRTYGDVSADEVLDALRRYFLTR